MSGTRCTISILKKDKTIKTITANYDGGLLQAGKILNNNYKSPLAVEKLISEGNISGLHSDENLSEKSSAKISKSKKEYLLKTQGFDYNYIFDEVAAQWSILKSNQFKSLNDEIEAHSNSVIKKRKM